MYRTVARLFHTSANVGASSISRVKTDLAVGRSLRSIASIPLRRNESSFGSPDWCHISHSAASARAARTRSSPRKADNASSSVMRLSGAPHHLDLRLSKALTSHPIRPCVNVSEHGGGGRRHPLSNFALDWKESPAGEAPEAPEEGVTVRSVAVPPLGPSSAPLQVSPDAG